MTEQGWSIVVSVAIAIVLCYSLYRDGKTIDSAREDIRSISADLQTLLDNRMTKDDLTQTGTRLLHSKDALKADLTKLIQEDMTTSYPIVDNEVER